jgi:hypothetical protein
MSLSPGTLAVLLQPILRFIFWDRAAQHVQQGPVRLLEGLREQFAESVLLHLLLHNPA